MVCPMRFFLVAASAFVALFSALAGLLGWTQPKGGKYGSDESDDQSDGSGGEVEDEKVGGGEGGATTSSLPMPRARRRRRGKKPQNRSARQLAWTGLSALWDAFTGRYLARVLFFAFWRMEKKTKGEKRAASSSRSASPQRIPEEEKGLRLRNGGRGRRSSSKAG
jgi:hypothetical protein